MTGTTETTTTSPRRSRWTWTIGRRLVAGYVVALVLLTAIGTVSFFNSEKLIENSRWVAHSHEVLAETDAIVSALQDAETGQLGFVITGADSYLDPYDAARVSVNEHLTTARGLTADNAEQQKRFSTLVSLVGAKFAEMQKTIAERKDDGFEDAQAIIVSDEGKGTMDEIRGLLDEIRADEEALLEERDAAASATVTTTKAVVVGGTVTAILIVLVLATFLTRSITRPINGLTTRLREIADGDGDLTQRVDESGADEVGALATVFNRFIGNVATLVRQIGETASTSATAAQELAVITTEMARQSTDAAHQAGSAASAAEQVSSNVQAVAAASEQIGASIHEIARSTSDATDAGRTAVDGAREANTTINRLGESSATIGDVVALITTIAQQTNLLALNATIEAARAGEAGKGFAVVAGEVKELAQQTAKATEEITSRIRQIQSDVDVAVASIATTTQVIGEVNDHQGSIAGAIEEQSVTTSAMASNVSEAAVGATTIADTVRSIADNAQASVQNIDQVGTSAEELARSSQHLNELVGQFKV